MRFAARALERLGVLAVAARTRRRFVRRLPPAVGGSSTPSVWRPVGAARRFDAALKAAAVGACTGWLAVVCAAPVSLPEEAGGARATAGQPMAAPSAGAALTTSMSILDKSMTPAATTGVDDLDLLLESANRQGRPDAEARRAAPISAAAASAAAAELGVLRARAALLLRSPAAIEQAERAELATRERQALPVQSLGEIGTWQGDRRAVEAAPVRLWSGADEGGAERPVMREPWREAGAPPATLDDDHPLKRLPREILEFLRDNRFELLGTVGVLAALAALLKLYSRRV